MTGALALAREPEAAATYQVMPPLSDEDFAALKADIAERGVLVPIEYDENGLVLDGHHRIRACEQLGIAEWPRLIREGLTQDEKRVHARQLNLARRHLNQAQKRELVADQLRDTPERSDRQIAGGLGVHHETVAAVRDDLAGRGEIRHVTTKTDTLGRVQPARKPQPTKVKYVDPSPAGVAGAKERARDIRDDETAEVTDEQRELRATVNEAAERGLRQGSQSPGPSRKNPHYEPDPQWDAMLAVSAGCRDMMAKVRDFAPEYIIGGFIDDAQRGRNIIQIRECRDFLTSVLEAADAEQEVV